MWRRGRAASVATTLILIAGSAIAATHAQLTLDMYVPPRIPGWRPVVLDGKVRNSGPDPAEGVTITATTSTGATVQASLECGGIEPTQCATIAPGAEQRFVVRIPNDGSETSFRLDVRVTTTTSDLDPTDDQVSATVAVTNGPLLQFTLFGPIADPGALVQLEARIYNYSDIDARNVSFKLPLTDGWTFGQSLSPELTCSPSDNELSCTIPRIAALESSFVRLTLRAPARIEGAKGTATRITLTTDHGVLDDSRASAYFYTPIYRHLTVTHTGDDGKGSLRQAFIDANAGCASRDLACKIVFDIEADPQEGRHTIRLLTPLPKLAAGRIIIDGATQRNRRGDTNPQGPEIEISGLDLTTGNGIESGSENFELREVVVNGFPENGIVLQSGYNTIHGCYIGTDATGRHPIPNRLRGIVEAATGGTCRITNNVVSGNGRSGIYISPGRGVSVSIDNNRIGAAAGPDLAELGNGASGIYFGPGIWGAVARANVIAFNAQAGVSIEAQAEDVALYANALLFNGGIGIDYGLDGVTPNSSSFRKAPNFPVLTLARYDEAQKKTTIEGHIEVDYLPGFGSAVEFFASEAAGASGHGEAAVFLGRLSGVAREFRFQYDGDLRGRYVTATFTLPSRYYPEALNFRTSELSEAIRVGREASGPFDYRASLPHGADVSLSFYVYGPRVAAGQKNNVYLTFGNAGPFDAEQVTASMRISGAAALRVPGGGLCKAVGGDQIVCSVGHLVAGRAESVSFDIETPVERRTIEVSASISSITEDPDPSNNEQRSSFEVIDKPVVAVEVLSPRAVDPAASALYGVRVVNTGFIAAHDVTIEIPLRSGWSFIEASGSWQCSADPREVVCRNPIVEPQSEQFFTLTLRAPGSPLGQRREFDQIEVTAANGLFYESYASIVTEVIRQYSVTTTADGGNGSLRDVIAQANSQCPKEFVQCKVRFELPPPVPAEGYYSIHPRTALPPVTTGLIIDASTQTERTGDTNPLGPEIELSGTDVVSGNGVEIRSGERTLIRGLAINGFPENGIAVIGSFYGYYLDRRVIADCYIGTDATGRRAIPNRLRGVFVQVPPGGYSANVDILSSVISGNDRSGVFAASGSDIRILSNRIESNGASGIYLGSVGSARIDQNVIAFNGDMGVAADRSASSVGIQRNVFVGNRQLAIDYGLDSVTRNDDPGRPDYLPEFPLLLSAVCDGTGKGTRIEGAAAQSRFLSDGAIVDLYRNGGEEWLGEVVLDPSAQSRPFSLLISRDLQGSTVTATFTRTGAGSQFRWTSEFSDAIPVVCATGH